MTNHEEHVAATRAVIAAVKRCGEQGWRRPVLYYLVRASDALPGVERVATSDLTAAGGRDYGKVAQQSKAFYLSQFLPERIHEVPAEQCLVRATDAD